jgi:hypothetical protein
MAQGATVAGSSKNHHRMNDRASQQRVLLRILTAFPFHCNDFISSQHQNITNIYDLSIQTKLLF